MSDKTATAKEGSKPQVDLTGFPYGSAGEWNSLTGISEQEKAEMFSKVIAILKENDGKPISEVIEKVIKAFTPTEVLYFACLGVENYM